MTIERIVDRPPVEEKETQADDLMRLFVNKIIDRVLEDRKQGIIRG